MVWGRVLAAAAKQQAKVAAIDDPSAAPSVDAQDALELAEEEHEYDAVVSLLLNITLIGCLLLAYTVKRFRIYSLPESTGALLVGMVVGGVARLTSSNRLQLFEFSPEVFFFVLLPPIIFEAGYSLQRKDFFDNIGAITLYAMFGTIISTFTVGGLVYYAARAGWIRNISSDNPMEALLFGALISAVDPVATLSIMGNPELQVHPLLYSLVFGESVLNDAVAISLFKVFAKYYKEESLNDSSSIERSSSSEAHQIAAALLNFTWVSLASIGVGVGLGLGASYLYKHTDLNRYPHLETALLMSFCYLCYSVGESLGLSGIMALFFQGMVLSHYNVYNLSRTAHVASEQVFLTLATLAETAVFLYMGMAVFTSDFHATYDPLFSILALVFCWIGRFLNIAPLSWIANACRTTNRIGPGMQTVLWFAGLRGAIAFALAMNMPGQNAQVYATATLSICIFTTVVCGGLTDRMLTLFDMKQGNSRPSRNGASEGDQDESEGTEDGDDEVFRSIRFTPASQKDRNKRRSNNYPLARRTSQRVYKGAKLLWKQFDDDVLKPYFGGEADEGGHADAHEYELSRLNDEQDNDDDEDDEREEENGNEAAAFFVNDTHGSRSSRS